MQTNLPFAPVPILGILCVATALAAALLHAGGYHRAKLIGKLAASLFFCAEGLYALAYTGAFSAKAMLFAGALVFALIGDLLLAQFAMVKQEYHSFVYILGGGCFLLGHILYIIWFLLLAPLRTPVLLLIAALVPMLYFILNKVGILKMGSMAVAIYGYALALGGMLMATVNIGIALHFSLPLIAGLLFTLSDSCLFLSNHGSEGVKRYGKALGLIVMLAYYLAQAIFAALPALSQFS